MLKLFTNMKKADAGLSLVALFFVVMVVWLDLTMPEYMSKITTLVQTEGSAMSEIWKAGGMMLLCALGSMTSSVIVAICAARIASGFSATLRRKLFKKVQGLSTEEIGNFSTASLITRSTNDVTQIQMLVVMGLQAMLRAPIMAAWAIIKIVNSAWQWTFTTAMAIGVQLVIVILCISLATPKFKQLQFLTDELNRVARENLTGLSVVRAYNAEKYQEDKFEDANARLTRTHLFGMRAMAFQMPAVQMVMSGLSLAIYWVGASVINAAGTMDKLTLFSDMIVFSQYAIMIVMSFMMLVMIFMILPRAMVAAGRINEVLDTPISIFDGTREDGADGLEGDVEFKNVTFSYPDAERPVLDNITFTAHKGETVALIGSTGCGKSSLINLIPRFYDVTDGQVLVDGVDVRDYKQESLRNKIGYISQKATLFRGTVMSNIAFGSNGREKASEEEVLKAVDVAQSTDFVENLEDGVNGYVAQGGANFSGGQKQRISIARAIARDPEILIFDDSFSALDYRTDRALRKALDEKCKGTTRIIVAQRIGTIRDADKIIVLDEGRIAGMGKHDELMATCDVYKQIALSQLSEAELA